MIKIEGIFSLLKSMLLQILLLNYYLFLYLEEDQDQDQIAVAKKYEMLNDRDATKLKLELEGGEKHREKKNSAGTDINTPSTSDAITNLPDANKDDEENIVKDEVIETSDIVATADDDLIGESTVDETIKDDIATNMDLSNTKDNQTFTYDPEIAIGIENLDIIIFK